MPNPDHTHVRSGSEQSLGSENASGKPFDYSEGWLIEDFYSEVSAPRYLTLEEADSLIGLTWTLDHEKALRFSRRADAEAYARCHLDEVMVRLCEHAWGTPINEVAHFQALKRRSPLFSELREVVQRLVDEAGETIRIRGQERGIEMDDGEKGYLVHSDVITQSRAALSKAAGEKR